MLTDQDAAEIVVLDMGTLNGAITRCYMPTMQSALTVIDRITAALDNMSPAVGTGTVAACPLVPVTHLYGVTAVNPLLHVSFSAITLRDWGELQHRQVDVGEYLARHGMGTIPVLPEGQAVN